jgi:hypothetical protein
LDELFDKGADLESDTLIQLARLFEPNKFILKLIEQGYSIGLKNNNSYNNLTNNYNQTDLTYQENLDLIKSIVTSKGLVTRNNKTMITTYGIRHYLTNLIIKVCVKYNK